MAAQVPPTASDATSGGVAVPAHLEDKIRAHRPQMEGERRTVTVLFVDAVASTALAERLDEEDVYYLMQGAVAAMTEAVHRYEGVVTQFLGDGIVALFGAPIAHEDAARRAVSAALDMRVALRSYADQSEREYGDSVQFRVGLNTGPVVVGSISDDLQMDFTAIGDTINLAARLQQLAPAGEILVSERTWRAVRDYFEFEDAGLLEVKGKAAAVRAYRPLRQRAVRTRIQAAAEHGLTPFVGREQELGLLREALAAAVRGEGQVVFVAGEAGMGKSRLLLEFRREVEDDDLGWLEGHCISFGRAIPYLPIVEIVQRSLGVEESNDEASILRRVAEATAGWEVRARAGVAYLRHLLNVDPGDPAVARLDPRERQARVFDALRTLVVMASREHPLVVLVEDLHWADEKSQEALAALVDVVAATPVLLLLTYRPGWTPSLGDRTYFHRLTLRRLPEESTAAMARAVLEAGSLPPELVRLVNEKAEGNPFYTEEVAKSLLESGVLRRTNGTYELVRPVEDLRLPETIQEVILSRIDRLQRAAREALQLASVIGREFTGRLLGRISDLENQLDDALRELKRLELVYQKEYFPELSYMFKHALTHDVAYATLLRERRRALHRLVGAAIEELYPDRLAEQAETLAHHYTEAQAWDRALDYLARAGEKAAGNYANRDALDYFGRALEVAQRLGAGALPTAVGLAESRGFVHLTIGDVEAAGEDFERMRELAVASDDRRQQGRALALRGLIEVFAHSFEQAEQTLLAAFAIGQEGYDDVRLLTSVTLTELYTTINRHAEAEPFVRLATELADTVEEPFALAWWSLMALLPNWAARSDEALAHIERWRPAAQDSGSAMMALAQRWVEGLVRGFRGEYERALDLLHGVISEAERIGEVLIGARALNSVGWIYAELQDHDRALEWSRRGVDAALQIEAPDFEVEGNARLNVGDALLALGRPEEAEEQFAAVERIARNPTDAQRYMLWRYTQHLYHSYGELWLARGDAERALVYADDCLALAESTDSRKNTVKARRLRGQALLALGRADQAEQEITLALEVAEEIGNPTQTWKTFAALGRLRDAEGRAQEARVAWGDALGRIEDLAATLEDADLRVQLLDAAPVRAIRAAAQVR